MSSDATLKIPIAKLREAADKLFTHLEDQGISSVELDVDYYWTIPSDQLYDPYQQPTEFGLGQLSDDWSEMEKIINNTREPISYCFVWLATILRAIGEKLVV
jgi:hypothetical protein